MTGASASPAAFPARPAITAPFACAMVFWAACAIAYAGGDMRLPDASTRLAGASLAASLVAAPFVIGRKTRMAAVLSLSLFVGFALGNAEAASIHANAAALDGLKDQDVELTLLEDSRDVGFGESALVEARIGSMPVATLTARFGRTEPMLVGERVLAKGSLSAIDYSSNPYAWNEGSSAMLKVAAAEKAPAPLPLAALVQFRAAAIAGIGASDGAHALLQALVCGYRRNITGTEAYSCFQSCGLAHLVAVSGAHLVIVAGLAAAIMERMRLPRKAIIGALACIMGSYFVVAGMPVSALRAMAMSLLGLASYFGRRRASSLSAVGIATFAILASSPKSCVSASFALSALSTVGIVLFSPLFQAWLDRTPMRALPVISDSLALTVAASMLSQLYACSLFNQLPVISPLANIVTAPLFAPVCASGLLLGLACSAPLPRALIDLVASALATVMESEVGLLASAPYASVPFSVGGSEALALSVACALALWALWPKPSLRGFAAAGVPVLVLALSFGLLADRSDAIVMLDVGQGDAILVQSRGQRYLVDTGNQDSRLLEQLASNHVAHLDGVVISHADDDHCGSIDALEKAVAVDRIILAADMLECSGQSARGLVAESRRCVSEVIGVEAGDSFEIGAFTARVVWPRAFVEDGGNADSLCLLLEYDGDSDGVVDFKALLTGDAEKEQLADMLDAGAVGDVDILKVGHHGSRNGMTSEQAKALAPEVALISCGAHNRYGHPTQEILDMLDDVGARTMRTDRDGEIRCTLTPERLVVS